MLAAVPHPQIPQGLLSASEMTKSASASLRMWSGFAVFGSDTAPSCSV